jgi:DNA-binding NarL/FixJ family response regulator
VDKQVNPNLYGIRILIVEDDAFTRKIVRRVLAELTFNHVDEMESAETALALLQGQTFDLIITDVQMVGINGLELVRRIRAGLTTSSPDTRTIVLTSFSNTEVLGVAMALDVNGFLVKPIKPAVVEDKIAQAMSEQSNVKPTIAYQSIKTDLRTIQSQRATERDQETVNASMLRSSESEWARMPQRKIPLAQLQPGLRVGQQVMTSDGTLLLREGHVLSRLNINRLLDLRTVLTDEFLWIVSEGAEPATP